MKIGSIVLLLRLANINSFENYIGGAAQLELATQGTLTRNMMFVVPVSEDANDSIQDTGVVQQLTESFCVVVALKNDTDPTDLTGLTAYDSLHDIREQLIKWLVGLDIGYASPISFKGGKLLAIDPSFLWYEYDFSLKLTVGTDEGGYGYIETGTVEDRMMPGELPDFNSISTQYVYSPGVKWDAIKEIMRQKGTHLPLAASLPDMSTWVDMSKPYTGGFNAGYFVGFDRWRVNK
jgi:hypothetical protein